MVKKNTDLNKELSVPIKRKRIVRNDLPELIRAALETQKTKTLSASNIAEYVCSRPNENRESYIVKKNIMAFLSKKRDSLPWCTVHAEKNRYWYKYKEDDTIIDKQDDTMNNNHKVNSNDDIVVEQSSIVESSTPTIVESSTPIPDPVEQVLLTYNINESEESYTNEIYNNKYNAIGKCYMFHCQRNDKNYKIELFRIDQNHEFTLDMLEKVAKSYSNLEYKRNKTSMVTIVPVTSELEQFVQTPSNSDLVTKALSDIGLLFKLIRYLIDERVFTDTWLWDNIRKTGTSSNQRIILSTLNNLIQFSEHIMEEMFIFSMNGVLSIVNKFIEFNVLQHTDLSKLEGYLDESKEHFARKDTTVPYMYRRLIIAGQFLCSPLNMKSFITKVNDNASKLYKVRSLVHLDPDWNVIANRITSNYRAKHNLREYNNTLESFVRFARNVYSHTGSVDMNQIITEFNSFLNNTEFVFPGAKLSETNVLIALQVLFPRTLLDLWMYKRKIFNTEESNELDKLIN
jgi:hypothetical protein